MCIRLRAEARGSVRFALSSAVMVGSRLRHRVEALKVPGVQRGDNEDEPPPRGSSLDSLRCSQGRGGGVMLGMGD
jgi:hypothetical protein